jgi:hypothetical protein
MQRENWERARREDKRTARVGHYATINATGIIAIGRFTDEALGLPEAVHIFFDSPNNSLVLQKVHPRAEDAYPVKPMGRHGGKLIRAAQAPNQFGLKVNRTVRFLTADVDEKGLLVLDPRETQAVGRGKHRSK